MEVVFLTTLIAMTAVSVGIAGTLVAIERRHTAVTPPCAGLCHLVIDSRTDEHPGSMGRSEHHDQGRSS